MPSTAKHVNGARDVSPSTVVQRMYDEARGDLNRAAEMTVNYVDNMPSLRKEFIRIAARQLLGQIGVVERRAIEREISCTHDKVKPFKSAPYRMDAGTRAAQARMRQRGNNHFSALFDMKFKVNGVDTRLGDMTGQQAIAEGSAILAVATKSVRTGRFLINVGNAAGGKRVQDAVSTDEIARIKAEADGETI